MPHTALVVLDNSIDPTFYRPVEHWAQVAGRPLAAVWVAGGAPLPEPGAHTHVLITGSESSILDPPPWASAEMAWLRAAVAAGARVLGSCWGHQMMAAALGGAGCVRRSPTPEYGWFDIEVHEPDAILPSGGFAACCLHSDEVVPGSHPELRVLASSPRCAVHAFRWGSLPVWGVQSHPEIDPPTGRAMLAEAMERWPEEAELYRAALAGESRDSRHARAILDAFLAV
ncbi:MAG TPA: hypothetical protein P5234_03755 [Thermoanaerobaculaceae bacterium]|nr:hypothetical protein [Thermoanaerobaculaceae bacterium]HRS15345.1 hypothetical protein [Thermoanaerobaculaceae bacterium]